ncbi:MAG: toxic anion resistance protein [Succinivibrionaceae bacterium]|nr:toxic anion resistance protein [Succinivibrionaceae bacterium]
MTDQTTGALEEREVPPQALERALAEIDFADPNLTVTYGTKTMGRIAAFSDSILSNVKVKDSGVVGEHLSSLMEKVQGIDIETIAKPGKSFLASLPIIGSLFDKVRSTVAQFDDVSSQIDGIAKKLEDAQMGLLKDIGVLEELFKQNQGFYEDLSAHIKAGEQRLEQERATTLKRLEEEAKQGEDSFAAQKLRDFADSLNRFERRLHDLKLSRTITMQTAPQIRMIQSNDRTLAEKIQTSILATIPIWKNQMVLALSINSQRNAAQLQKEVADTTNKMLSKNAEMLQSSTVETAREVERSVVDIETLRDVQGKLLSTIEETINIAHEGREKRRAADEEMKKMEQELKERLVNLAARRREDAIEGAKGPDAAPGEGK